MAGDWRVADLGSSRGVLSAQLAEKVAHVTSADVERPPDAGAAEAIELDLDGDFDRVLGRHQYDCVLVLDVLEHLKRPEEGVRKIAEILKPGGTLYASTGNIAFLVMRLSLFLGQFNYGKRGILDLTHTRLFTIYSFKKLLTNGGFVIKEVHGFGPPDPRHGRREPGAPRRRLDVRAAGTALAATLRVQLSDRRRKGRRARGYLRSNAGS